MNEIDNINSAEFSELETALQMIKRTAMVPGEQAGAALKIAIDKIYKDENASTSFRPQSYVEEQRSTVNEH